MKHLFYLAILLLFISCENKEQKAREVLSKAQEQYNRQEYFGAKQTLDSLKIKYPKEFPVLKEGQFLFKKVELAEQTRNLHYCDSMIQVKMPEVEPLKKDFIYERDTAYEETGKYIYKTQRIELNVQRCYIRSGVSESGEMFLSSVYYGSKPIKHEALRVSSKGDEYAQTNTIPPDGSNNYSFTDGGMTTETVTYTGGNDNGVILFIYNKAQAKNPVTATYVGEKNISIAMSEADKTVVMKTYDLSAALLEIEKLKKDKKTAEIKIAYLQEKMKDGEE